MLQVTVACARPSDDVVLTVCDDGDVVVFEKKCCCILDDVFLVKDMTDIYLVAKKLVLFTYCSRSLFILHSTSFQLRSISST